MKIIINGNNGERQAAVLTIDTETCQYPNAIRDALELALKHDGYPEEIINEVFNLQPVRMPAPCEDEAQMYVAKFPKEEDIKA